MGAETSQASEPWKEALADYHPTAPIEAETIIRGDVGLLPDNVRNSGTALRDWAREEVASLFRIQADGQPVIGINLNQDPKRLHEEVVQMARAILGEKLSATEEIEVPEGCILCTVTQANTRFVAASSSDGGKSFRVEDLNGFAGKVTAGMRVIVRPTHAKLAASGHHPQAIIEQVLAQ